MKFQFYYVREPEGCCVIWDRYRYYVREIECNVPCHTRWIEKHHPRMVMEGNGTQLKIIDQEGQGTGKAIIN